MKKIAKVMVAVIATSVGIAQAELITNGGFEADVGGVTVVPNGWTVVNVADKVKDITGTLDGLAPQEGNNVFQLQQVGGSNPKTSGISQTITVTDTGTYEMSGWFAPRDHSFGSAAYTFTLTDSLSALVVADASVDPAITMGAWNEITRTYNSLAAGDYTVAFVNTGTANLLQGSIDNFSFEAIPEPATLGMVAVFGGGILFIRRRLMI